MKRYIILFALMILAIHSYSTPVTIYPGLTLEENSGTYYIHFEMPKYDIVTDTFTVIHTTPLPSNLFGHAPGDYHFNRVQPIEDDYFDYLSIDGRPMLPFYSLNLLMPLDGGNYSVTAHVVSTETIKLPLHYTPSQSENYTFEDFSEDVSYYSSFNNSWYWNDYSSDTLMYRMAQGITFSIFPCHYEPSDRELTIVTEADFEISYTGSNLNVSYLAYLLSLERSLYFFFDNYVGYPEPYPSIQGDGYLIITEDAWNNTVALSDFIHHKESLGYHVTKTPLHDIGYMSEDIRKYIKNEYETNNIKFVLLVGNVEGADSLAFSAGTEGIYQNPPTDIYYSCLTKNDINDQWRDFSPTVFVGRWPIQDSAQLRLIVDKSIASDLYLGGVLSCNSSSKISLFSGDDPSNAYSKNYFYNDCQYIYNKIIYPYSYYTGHVTDGRDASTNFNSMKNEMEIIDNPTWMFVYRGHGSSGGIWHPYDWYDYEINDISTSSLPFQPFGFGFSCLLGDIYQNHNFARAWLMNKEGGVTFLGATTISFSECNRYFSRKMFNQLEGQPNMTIGEFICNAKAKYYNPLKVIWRQRESKKYVLYGDPSLYLFGLNIQYNQPHGVQTRSQLLEEESIEEITSIQIYSATGQLLRTCNGNQLDIHGLPAGTYMVVYNSENNKITKKIILK